MTDETKNEIANYLGFKSWDEAPPCVHIAAEREYALAKVTQTRVRIKNIKDMLQCQ